MGIVTELIVKLLAGLGVGMIWDKVSPSVPLGTSVTPPQTGLGFNLRTGIIAVCLLVGGIIVVFLGKKLKIKLFK